MKTRGFEQELANAYIGEWMPMKSPGLTGLILTTNLEPFSKPPQIRHMNEVPMCAHQCNNTQKWQMCSCTDLSQVGFNCTCIIQATTSFQWWDQRTEKVKLRQICCPCSPSCWYSMVLMATNHGVHKLWVRVHKADWPNL